MGNLLDPEEKEKLTKFLKENLDVLAWNHENMTEIKVEDAIHRHCTKSMVKHVKQKKRRLIPKKNKIIEEEVERLLKSGMMREV